MDSRLKIFYTEAQLKSFTKAAHVLNLTQPAITFQIKNLEDELKTRLFNRDANKITLTQTGKILFRHAGKILQEYEKTKEEIANLTGKLFGDIRIGIASLLGKYLLPKLIGFFKNEYPDIELQMLVGNSGKLIQELKEEARQLCTPSTSLAMNQRLIEIWELNHLIDISVIIAQSALQRKESRGAHFREDYPKRRNEFNYHTLVTMPQFDKINIGKRPIDMSIFDAKEENYEFFDFIERKY